MAKSLFCDSAVIIDLSADFRFEDVEIYEGAYVPHTAQELVPHLVYGLPELYRKKIAKSKLIGNPGCYPTSAILALYPLLKERLLERGCVHRLEIRCERRRTGSKGGKPFLRGIGRIQALQRGCPSPRAGDPERGTQVFPM